MLLLQTPIASDERQSAGLPTHAVMLPPVLICRGRKVVVVSRCIKGFKLELDLEQAKAIERGDQLSTVDS